MQGKSTVGLDITMSVLNILFICLDLSNGVNADLKASRISLFFAMDNIDIRI
jgi:hypothetical protein